MRQLAILTTTAFCVGLACSANVLAEISTNPTPPTIALQPAAPVTPTPSGKLPGGTDAKGAKANAAAPITPATALPAEPEKSTGVDLRAKIKDAVVKVYVVKHTYDFLSPWNSDTQKGSGSGLIIKDNLILTNAHVAADTTFIEVQRHGETKRFEAEVVYISNEADLALLRTKDKSAYANIKPLEFGDLPRTQQKVEVYGFPIGGNTLSITQGVVSRIEKQNYAHTGENLIAAQVDAAINFGNSGGPVISDDKVVGVAMQSGVMTENIGYMIPTPIIQHFMDDIKDGKADGFGFHGFLTQSLENAAARRKYGMNDQQTGVLIHKVYKNSPSDGKIEVGDILTAIDGHTLENDGTVEFRPGEFIDHTHYIDMHQIGEDLKVKIIRKGQEQEVSLHLDKPGKEYLLVKPNQYDRPPTYFIFGGFVFMPLNQDLIDANDHLSSRISALAYESPDEKRSEAVLMTKVLPADINKDYHYESNLVIGKVNGEAFHDFREFFNKIQTANSDYITLQGTDDYQIVIDRKEALAKQPAILARYGIAADRSKDLGAAPASTAAKPSPAPAPLATSVTVPVPAGPFAPATDAAPH